MYGNTELHEVLRFKEFVKARELIKSGADVNALNDANQTPLHIAVFHGTPASEVVHFYWKKGQIEML